MSIFKQQLLLHNGFNILKNTEIDPTIISYQMIGIDFTKHYIEINFDFSNIDSSLATNNSWRPLFKFSPDSKVISNNFWYAAANTMYFYVNYVSKKFRLQFHYNGDFGIKEFSFGNAKTFHIFVYQDYIIVNDIYIYFKDINIPITIIYDIFYAKPLYIVYGFKNGTAKDTGGLVKSFDVKVMDDKSLYVNHYPINRIVKNDEWFIINTIVYKYKGQNETVVVPDYITDISTAFSGNTTLKTIIVPDSLTSFGTNCFKNCTNLESINMPSNLEYIGKDSFWQTGLKGEIVLPNTVTYIARNAFYHATKIESVVISDNVETIYRATFEGCTSLKYVTIGKSVKYMGTQIDGLSDGIVFRSCPLKELHFRNPIPPTCTTRTFNDITNTTYIIYVPTGSLESYKSAANFPNPSTITYMEEDIID